MICLDLSFGKLHEVHHIVLVVGQKYLEEEPKPEEHKRTEEVRSILRMENVLLSINFEFKDLVPIGRRTCGENDTLYNECGPRLLGLIANSVNHLDPEASQTRSAEREDEEFALVHINLFVPLVPDLMSTFFKAYVVAEVCKSAIGKVVVLIGECETDH